MATTHEGIRQVAASFGAQRAERQLRRSLDPQDFAALAATGFLLTSVPVEHGGFWESTAASIRPICEMLRILAQGDSSVALVAAMHPAVLLTLGWPEIAHAPAPHTEAWEAQRRWAAETARDGHWWGTITSEPGSGGDMMRTRTLARPDGEDLRYRISGDKHFGSGSGVTSYVMTSALAEGEERPDLFIIDLRDVPWDGSQGVTLTTPWDGHGMTATQSHAFRFADVPVLRAAWPDFMARRGAMPGGQAACMFTAVITGVVEVAVNTARAALAPRAGSLRAYEQVEWTRIELETWLIAQAYEGMLRAAEQLGGKGTLHAKTAVAELAESVLTRLCKVMGGGSFGRGNPYGHWFEDVRALGFLRPPWGLAFDELWGQIWAT